MHAFFVIFVTALLSSFFRKSWNALNNAQGPRELKKSVRAQSPKYAPKIRIFAFYCIFSLQFSKVSEGPGPHGPHTHEALACATALIFNPFLKLIEHLGHDTLFCI